MVVPSQVVPVAFTRSTTWLTRFSSGCTPASTLQVGVR